MQLTKTVDKPVFNPITLNITFDTQAEYEMFKHIFLHYISIPDVVYHTNDIKRKKLTELMTKINDVL